MVLRHLFRRPRRNSLLDTEGSTEDEACAESTPSLRHLGGLLAGEEQVEILVAHLHYIGMADKTLHPLAPVRGIRLDVEAHVGIESQQAVSRLALEQGEQRRADRVHGQ